MARKLTIGLSLSLTGPYAAMGRQAEAAMHLFTGDVNAGGGIVIAGDRYELALECIDDEGSIGRTAEIYRTLCTEKRADLIFGPYSSALTRVAAPIAESAGMLFVNHGGASDGVYEHGYRMIAGILTPASEYMAGFVHLLTTTLKFWRKRVAIVSSKSPFARAVAAGAERACAERRARRRGVRLRLKYAGSFDPDRTADALRRALRRNRINAMISAGSYEHDLAMMRLAASPHFNIPVLGCVAAGVDRFRADLGEDAEGIVGCSQWERDAEVQPEIGPTPAEFVRRMYAASAAGCDYPAAQAYAAGLVAIAALRAADSIEQNRLRGALSDLRTTTFYGDFAIDRVTGRQIGHKMLLVQWHAGRKVIIDPEPQIGGGELEFPSGWRVLIASLRYLRLKRNDNAVEDEGDEQD